MYLNVFCGNMKHQVSCQLYVARVNAIDLYSLVLQYLKVCLSHKSSLVTTIVSLDFGFMLDRATTSCFLLR